MSTPQLEDGYIRIANALYEAIMLGGFSQRELLVLLAIMRKTYGYGKTKDDMSASQIGALCGVARQHVTTTLNALASRNVITKRHGEYGMVIGIQKDLRQWVTPSMLKGQQGAPIDEQSGSPKSGLVPNQDASRIGTGDSPDSGQVDSPESGHTKDNLPKDNLKRQITPKPPDGGFSQPKSKNSGIVLKTFLEGCKDREERPVANYEPLWRYTEGVGLPTDFVSLAWYEFCRQFLPGGTGETRRYADWRKAFRNYVEKNYMKLWAIDGSGQYYLTTLGKQAQKFYDSKEAA